MIHKDKLSQMPKRDTATEIHLGTYTVDTIFEEDAIINTNPHNPYLQGVLQPFSED